MKGGEALETASSVDSVIFDKTGTLTKGKPGIIDFITLGPPPSNAMLTSDASTDDYLLWLIASLERTSEHPLAKAVVTYAESRLGEAFLESYPFIQPSDFRALTGRGASGTVDGHKVAAGNRAFALALGLQVSPNIEACMMRVENEGKTAILAAVDGSICAVMGIADEVKPEAAASVSFLREKLNIDVWMVTGDNTRTAAAVSRQLGLPASRVIAEALPAAGVGQVRRLQAEGKIVAMVGDGINDSPALSQANVGISGGAGAEIATEAADMALVRGRVTDVCTALHLSRAIFRRIQLNLLSSLVYNCLGIPIAAGVFYPVFRTRLPPTVAAIAMALSSVSVVLSSLSLRLYKPPNIMIESNGSIAPPSSRGCGFFGLLRKLSRRRRSDEDHLLDEPLLEAEQVPPSVAMARATANCTDRVAREMEAGSLSLE